MEAEGVLQETGEAVICTRIRPEVPLPRTTLPRDSDIWDAGGVPNVDFLKVHFFEEGRLSNDQLQRLVAQANAVLREEPNMLVVPAPLTSKWPTAVAHFTFFFSCWGHPRPVLRPDEAV